MHTVHNTSSDGKEEKKKKKNGTCCLLPSSRAYDLSHPSRLRDYKSHARPGDPVPQAAEREEESVRLEDVDAYQTPGRGDQSDEGALPEEMPHGSNEIAGLV